MRENLAELWRYRYLLRMLVRRELQVRYKNSAFGYLWSIVPPLMQVFVYTFLFKGVLNVQIQNYSAYLLCGLIPWTFFSTALLDASQSLLIPINYGVIKKVYLPREAIPLANVFSNMVHFFIGWGVFFVAFVVVLPFFHAGIPLLPSMLLFPFLCLMLILLTVGLALWISALNVFYEDVKFIVMTLLNLLVFLLPVLYPADIAADKDIMKLHPWLFKLYMLNPIAALIDAFRKTLLEAQSPSYFDKKFLPGNVPRPSLPIDWTLFAGSCLIIVFITWSGYWYFNRRKWQFLERN